MDFIDAVKSRRTVRHYQSREVSESLLHEILQLATYSPFTGGLYPVEFILVRDARTISRLVENRYRKKDQSHHINVRKLIEKQIDQYEKLPPPPAIIVLCGNTQKSKYLGSLLPTVAISGQTIMLSANALGLASAWLFVYDPSDPSTETEVKSILNVPDNVLILSMIMIGHADMNVPLPQRVLPNLDEITHHNKW
jgi:nitroreductase